MRPDSYQLLRSPRIRTAVRASSYLSNSLILPQTLNDVKPLIDESKILLKTFVELNLASLKSHKDSALNLFYMLKYLDKNHSGFVPFDDVVNGLQTNFKYSKSRAYDSLTKYNGTFLKYTLIANI